MVFRVLAFVVFVGLADSYGIPWYKQSHGDCGHDFPHYHQPSPHGWNHPPPSHGWNWHPWHKPHLITTYSPVVVFLDEQPTTTEEAVTEPPQGSINVSSSGSGMISTAVEEDSARAEPSPQESDSASSEVSTTEAPVKETTIAYKVKQIEAKPAFYYKSYIPVHEGKYIAKTPGSLHIATLQGHARSVTVLNAEPAPGTV